MWVSTVSEASDREYCGCGRLRIAAVIAVLGAIAMLAGANAQAATIIVNSTADDTRAGHCTLREAINSANGASSDTGTCTAGDGDDTIRFSVSGTFRLTSTLPEILRILRIQGPTQNLSGIIIDGAGEYQVMQVSSEAALTLANLTVENGFIMGGDPANPDYGGGILNYGTLAVANSCFSDNTTGVLAGFKTGFGGGIANFGTLAVTNSIFSGNSSVVGVGGGIYNGETGTLTITDSIFTSNIAGKPPIIVLGGGGVFNESGTVTVTNSIFSANTLYGVFGGGIFSSYGTVTVTNSTFSSNSASFGGGVASVGGTVIVANSTFAGNTAENYAGGVLAGDATVAITNSTFLANSANKGAGGIFMVGSGTLSIKSSILADNTTSGDGSVDNCRGIGGTITDVGYNISDDDSCGFTQGTSANGLDPRLDPDGLKDNGGPTETVALEPNSPAIDAIPLDDCTDQASPPNRINTDQRGALRPDAGEAACDVGAYEFQDLAGQPDCNGKSVSALVQEYGSLAAAAAAYGFSSVKEFQSAIRVSCVLNAVAR